MKLMVVKVTSRERCVVDKTQQIFRMMSASGCERGGARGEGPNFYSKPVSENGCCVSLTNFNHASDLELQRDSLRAAIAKYRMM